MALGVWGDMVVAAGRAAWRAARQTWRDRNFNPQLMLHTRWVSREELERMYPMTPHQRCAQYFEAQRTIAREMSR